MAAFFPVYAIEFTSFELAHHIIVKTAKIQVHPVWMGAGNIKRMNATNFAEVVLGLTRIECVGRQGFIIREQFKIFLGNDHMQESLLLADRTIAFQRDLLANGCSEANRAAMTTTVELSWLHLGNPAAIFGSGV